MLEIGKKLNTAASYARKKMGATQAQQLERAIAEDEALLESIGDGVVATDSKGKIIFVNKAFENLLGRGAKNLLGRNLLEAMPLEDEKGNRIPTDERLASIVLSSGKTYHHTALSPAYYFIRRDKKRIPLAITAAPFILDGKISGSVGIYRDITEEKEINRTKNEFISLASHQLRTPLTSINLALGMILSGVAGELNKEQKKYLKISCRGVKEMTAIIDTLLNISRMELGTLVLNPEPINLAKFINGTLKNFDIQFKKKRINIKKEFSGDLPLISIDQRLMNIILENLFSNAIKYSPSGSEILITLKKNRNNAIISISDTGFGIPRDQQPKIFEKLFRVDNRQKVKGAGLGLYIAKAAVEEYGGKIWLESPSSRAFLKNKKYNSDQKGTTFFVAVPLDGMKSSK